MVDWGSRRRRHSVRFYRRAIGLDSFPNFETMDGHLGIDLEAQAYPAGSNIENRDFEHAMKIV